MLTILKILNTVEGRFLLCELIERNSKHRKKVLCTNMFHYNCTLIKTRDDLNKNYSRLNYTMRTSLNTKHRREITLYFRGSYIFQISFIQSLCHGCKNLPYFSLTNS